MACKMPPRKLIAMALVVAAIVLLAWRLAPPQKTGHVQAKYDRQIGLETAKAAQSLGPAPGRAALVTLAPMQGPLGRRAAGFSEEYSKAGRRIVEIDAMTGATSLYRGKNHEQDYSPSLNDVIRRIDPSVIVVMTAGDFTKTSITPRMKSFIASGGRFVFTGQLLDGRAPVLRLVREGSAVAVVRNAGPLAWRAPKDKEAVPKDPVEFFRQYYSVLTSENIQELLGVD